MKQPLFSISVLLIAFTFGITLKAQNAQLSHVEKALELVNAAFPNPPLHKEVSDTGTPFETLLQRIEALDKTSIYIGKSAEHLFKLDSISSIYSRQKFTYDSQGRISTGEFFQGLEDIEPFQLTNTAAFNYPTETLTEILNSMVVPETGDTLPFVRQYLTHDEDGQLVEYHLVFWMGDYWLDFSKIMYQYENGLNTQTSYYVWSDTEEWKLNHFLTFTYNNADQLILQEAFSWHEEAQEFLHNQTTTSTYDEDGYIIVRLIEQWSEVESQFVNFYKHVFEHDHAIVERTSIGYSWDNWNANPDWALELVETVQMDNFDQGNELSYHHKLWSAEVDDWIKEMGTNYTYNMDYTHDQIATPDYISANMRLYEANYTVYDGEQYEGFAYTYHYSDFVLNTKANNTSDYKLFPFPNPSGDVVSFSGMEHFGAVQLFNIQGALLKYEQLGPGQQMSIADLAPGIYVYTVQQGGERYQGKLVRK